MILYRSGTAAPRSALRSAAGSRRLRRKGQPARQPLHSSDTLRVGSHGVPNVRSSPRVHGSWHPSPAPAFAGSLRAPRWAKTGHMPKYGVLSTAVAADPVLSHRRSPCPRGRRLPGPLPRVAVRPFRTPFKTAGKKCVSKCATQFLLIGGKRRSTPITTCYSPGSSIMD